MDKGLARILLISLLAYVFINIKPADCFPDAQRYVQSLLHTGQGATKRPQKRFPEIDPFNPRPFSYKTAPRHQRPMRPEVVESRPEVEKSRWESTSRNERLSYRRESSRTTSFGPPSRISIANNIGLSTRPNSLSSQTRYHSNSHEQQRPIRPGSNFDRHQRPQYERRSQSSSNVQRPQYERRPPSSRNVQRPQYGNERPHYGNERPQAGKVRPSIQSGIESSLPVYSPSPISLLDHIQNTVKSSIGLGGRRPQRPRPNNGQHFRRKSSSFSPQRHQLSGYTRPESDNRSIPNEKTFQSRSSRGGGFFEKIQKHEALSRRNNDNRLSTVSSSSSTLPGDRGIRVSLREQTRSMSSSTGIGTANFDIGRHIGVNPKYSSSQASDKTQSHYEISNRIQSAASRPGTTYGESSRSKQQTAYQASYSSSKQNSYASSKYENLSSRTVSDQTEYTSSTPAVFDQSPTDQWRKTSISKANGPDFNNFINEIPSKETNQTSPSDPAFDNVLLDNEFLKRLYPGMTDLDILQGTDSSQNGSQIRGTDPNAVDITIKEVLAGDGRGLPQSSDATNTSNGHDSISQVGKQSNPASRFGHSPTAHDAAINNVLREGVGTQSGNQQNGQLNLDSIFNRPFKVGPDGPNISNPGFGSNADSVNDFLGSIIQNGPISASLNTEPNEPAFNDIINDFNIFNRKSDKNAKQLQGFPSNYDPTNAQGYIEPSSQPKVNTSPFQNHIKTTLRPFHKSTDERISDLEQNSSPSNSKSPFPQQNENIQTSTKHLKPLYRGPDINIFKQNDATFASVHTKPPQFKQNTKLTSTTMATVSSTNNPINTPVTILPPFLRRTEVQSTSSSSHGAGSSPVTIQVPFVTYNDPHCTPATVTLPAQTTIRPQNELNQPTIEPITVPPSYQTKGLKTLPPSYQRNGPMTVPLRNSRYGPKFVPMNGPNTAPTPFHGNRTITVTPSYPTDGPSTGSPSDATNGPIIYPPPVTVPKTYQTFAQNTMPSSRNVQIIVPPTKGPITLPQPYPKNGPVTMPPPNTTIGPITMPPPNQTNGPITMPPPNPTNGPVTMLPPNPSNGPITVTPPYQTNDPITVPPPHPRNGPITVTPPFQTNGPITVPPPNPRNGPITVPPPNTTNGPITVPPPNPANGPITMPPANPRNGPITLPRPYSTNGPVTMPQPNPRNGPITVPPPNPTNGPITVPPPYPTIGPITMSPPNTTNGPITVPPPNPRNGPITVPPPYTTNGQITLPPPNPRNGPITVPPPNPTNGPITVPPPNPTIGPITMPPPNTTNGPITVPPPNPRNGPITVPPPYTTNGPITLPPPNPRNGPITVPLPNPTNGPITVPPPNPTIGPITMPPPNTTNGPITVPPPNPRNGPITVPPPNPTSGPITVPPPYPTNGPKTVPPNIQPEIRSNESSNRAISVSVTSPSTNGPDTTLSPIQTSEPTTVPKTTASTKEPINVASSIQPNIGRSLTTIQPIIVPSSNPPTIGPITVLPPKQLTNGQITVPPPKQLTNGPITVLPPHPPTGQHTLPPTSSTSYGRTQPTGKPQYRPSISSYNSESPVTSSPQYAVTHNSQLGYRVKYDSLYKISLPVEASRTTHVNSDTKHPTSSSKATDKTKESSWVGWTKDVEYSPSGFQITRPSVLGQSLQVKPHAPQFADTPYSAISAGYNHVPEGQESPKEVHGDGISSQSKPQSSSGTIVKPESSHIPVIEVSYSNGNLPGNSITEPERPQTFTQGRKAAERPSSFPDVPPYNTPFWKKTLPRGGILSSMISETSVRPSNSVAPGLSTRGVQYSSGGPTVRPRYNSLRAPSQNYNPHVGIDVKASQIQTLDTSNSLRKARISGIPSNSAFVRPTNFQKKNKPGPVSTAVSPHTNYVKPESIVRLQQLAHGPYVKSTKSSSSSPSVGISTSTTTQNQLLKSAKSASVGSSTSVKDPNLQSLKLLLQGPLINHLKSETGISSGFGTSGTAGRPVGFGNIHLSGSGSPFM